MRNVSSPGLIDLLDRHGFISSGDTTEDIQISRLFMPAPYIKKGDKMKHKEAMIMHYEEFYRNEETSFVSDVETRIISKDGLIADLRDTDEVYYLLEKIIDGTMTQVNLDEVKCKYQSLLHDAMREAERDYY